MTRATLGSASGFERQLRSEGASDGACIGQNAPLPAQQLIAAQPDGEEPG